MKQDAIGVEPVASSEASDLSLGLGWSFAVDRRPRGVNLRLEHPNQQPIEIEISMTARGPVIRASAVALEIDAVDEISARCERFSIDARDTVSVRARAIVHEASELIRSDAGALEMHARSGDIQLRANDDVQLLGEQILLNCEREPPLPAWIPVGPSEVTLPRQDASGDADLLAHLEPK